MQLQKKSRKINANALHKNLSIQFSLDGFSFCITNSETKEIIGFNQYTFNKPTSSPELLLTNLMEAFKNDEDLQHDFISITAIHQNQLATVVPDTYFDRNNLKPYLKFSVKTLPTDFITYDTIEKINAHNVYIPYVNINNYLFQNFGEFEFKHHSTVLIEKLLAQTTSHEKIMYVNVASNSIDIVVCNSEKLYLYNSFSYETKEDFLYYILFIAEQLALNPEEFQLTFIGDIEEESELFSIVYHYVRNINFISTESTFFNESEEFSNHTNYILVS